jgi:hypothetical protein
MERLEQEIVRAGTERADLLLDVALGGEHDDRHVAGVHLLRPDARGHLVAVELGQGHVEEDERRALGLPEPDALGSVGGRDCLGALLLERVRQQALDVRVVVDDEDLGRHQVLFMFVPVPECAERRRSLTIRRPTRAPSACRL